MAIVSSSSTARINGGVVEFTGDGIIESFNIPHLFLSQPRAHWVTRNDDTSGNALQSQAEDTTIVVTFLDSPPLNGEIVKLNWGAML